MYLKDILFSFEYLRDLIIISLFSFSWHCTFAIFSKRIGLFFSQQESNINIILFTSQFLCFRFLLILVLLNFWQRPVKTTLLGKYSINVAV